MSRLRLRIWSCETGSAVPSRVSLFILYTQLRLNLVLITHGIPPAFRDGVIVHLYYNTGQSRAFAYRRWRRRARHSQVEVRVKQLLLLSDITMNHFFCVCVFSSHSFWTSSSLDVPAGATQEERHTGFSIHLLSAVRALIFLARRIQPFLALVDREVEFCVLRI